jgi:hypothetical protein
MRGTRARRAPNTPTMLAMGKYHVGHFAPQVPHHRDHSGNERRSRHAAQMKDRHLAGQLVPTGGQPRRLAQRDQLHLMPGAVPVGELHHLVFGAGLVVVDAVDDVGQFHGEFRPGCAEASTRSVPDFQSCMGWLVRNEKKPCTT